MSIVGPFAHHRFQRRTMMSLLPYTLGLRSDDATSDGVREGERNRIAQQIHDDLGGILTGLKACIAVAIDRRARSGFAPDPLLVDASALADLAFVTVRSIASNLRPTILEKMDLREALEWQVDNLVRRTDIQFDYFVDAALISIPFDEARALLVFRVVCEALTNVEKHAKASRISLRLFEEDGLITAIVSDNGVGIDHDARRGEGTLGISGMKKRARELGGVVALSPGAAGGTTVRLSVPRVRNDGV